MPSRIYIDRRRGALRRIGRKLCFQCANRSCRFKGVENVFGTIYHAGKYCSTFI